MGEPSTWELRAIQRELADYFAFWRAGMAHMHKREQRRDIIAKMRVPFWGKWPGFLPQVRRPAHHAQPIQKAWDEPGPSDTKFRAASRTQELSEKTRTAGFRFVKIIGWGGLGVASLFEITTEFGTTKKVVCKMDLFKEHSYIKKEIEMHVRTAGARHVTQRVVLQRPRADPSEASETLQSSGAAESNPRFSPGVPGSPPWHGQEELLEAEADDDEEFLELDRDEVMRDVGDVITEELDADPNMLFLEFMTRGRLEEHIGKVAMAKSRFPDQVLWTIFNSLYRGVLGLAFPDAYQTVGYNPRTHNMPQVSETSVGFPILTSHCKRETIIHFDLDYLNVLVGDFDANEHNIVPVIKIADLGLARIFDGGYSQTAWDYWKVRRSGKRHILTPEQFIEEWDYVNMLPESAGCQIAGNYNWWTNLYQAALIMFTLITLHEVEHPPVVERLELRRPDGTVTREWTYGGYLLDRRFDRTSETLRHLVALCLVADPTRRPDMATLNDAFSRHVRAEGPVTDNDRRAQAWAAHVFGGPPPPPPAPWFRPEDGRLPPGLRGPGDDVRVQAEKRKMLAKARIDRTSIRKKKPGEGVGNKLTTQNLMDKFAPTFVKDLFR